jgi:hypothetical protein
VPGEEGGTLEKAQKYGVQLAHSVQRGQQNLKFALKAATEFTTSIQETRRWLEGEVRRPLDPWAATAWGYTPLQVKVLTSVT